MKEIIVISKCFSNRIIQSIAILPAFAYSGIKIWCAAGFTFLELQTDSQRIQVFKKIWIFHYLCSPYFSISFSSVSYKLMHLCQHFFQSLKPFGIWLFDSLLDFGFIFSIVGTFAKQFSFICLFKFRKSYEKVKSEEKVLHPWFA